MRRAALPLLLAAACAPKHTRPAPDAELDRAVTADPGHGLLIFKHPSPIAQPRHWLAHQTVDGRTTWHRPVPARNILETDERIDILGGSALIPSSAGNTLPGPLTATDLDRFLLTDQHQVFHDIPHACDLPGTIDEAAWAALTPDPRTQTWLLR
jgi:hypothetical protein